jgi:hypothetical protein
VSESGEQQPRSIQDLLSKGEVLGHRSNEHARFYLPELKKTVGLPADADGSVDPVLEQFLVEAVLGAAWYAKQNDNAKRRVLHYICINVAVVLGVPVGLILLGAAAKQLNVDVLAAQVTGVLTGVLALQKTLSAWYSSQQRYAAWYKAAADLKSIYYGFVGRWGGKGADQKLAILADCSAQTDAARKVIDAEELDFYEHLTLPTFDVLDMLTSSRGTVSSFVTSLLPGGQATHVSMVGRNALMAPVGAAPPGSSAEAESTAAAGPSQKGVVVRAAGGAKPNDNPYTIVVLANPALQQYDNTLARDPIMDAPAKFETVVQDTIAALFGNLAGQTEKFMAPFQGQIRIVSIFDPNAATRWSNALVAEASGQYVVPLWQRIPDFLRGYQVGGKPLVPDVAIAVTSSPNFKLSGSWPAKDDPSAGGVPFVMDNVRYMHAYRNELPGMTALHSEASPLTALHEFSHAASSWENGYVFDLYNDISAGTGVVLLNKRWDRPIPANFGTYAGVAYKSDPTRGRLNYEPGWTSYHCELVNPASPALMDDYTQGTPPEACQHDKITVEFLTDRIRAIMSRP